MLPYDRVLFKTFLWCSALHHYCSRRIGRGSKPFYLLQFAPDLIAIDKHAGEKMVQGPRTLLEFAPFQGTQMGSTIALLAVEAVDYAKPLLSTLQKLSQVAGMTFFSVAEPFAEPLITGIQALSQVGAEVAPRSSTLVICRCTQASSC